MASGVACPEGLAAERQSAAVNDNTLKLFYPAGSDWPCPLCFRPNSVMLKGSCMYRRHEDLVKHVKLHHPNIVNKEWACGECSFTDRSAYAIRKVKKHFTDVHAKSRPRASGTGTTNATARGIAAAGRGSPVQATIQTEKRRPPDATRASAERASPGNARLSVDVPATSGGAVTRAPKPKIIQNVRIDKKITVVRTPPAPLTAASQKRTTPPVAPLFKRRSKAPSPKQSASTCDHNDAAGKDALPASGGAASMGRILDHLPTTSKPPQRTRTVTPTSTFADVTREGQPASTEAREDARRARAFTTPSSVARGGCSHHSYRHPPTMQMTACSASATLTTSTTTTSVCGRPIPSVEISPPLPSSGGRGGPGNAEVAGSNATPLPQLMIEKGTPSWGSNLKVHV